MAIESRNPATEQLLRRFDPHSWSEVNQRIEAASSAFNVLRELTFSERSESMQKLGSLLEAERDGLAETMTSEMGKTYASAKAEVDKCAWVCRFYAERAEEFLADEVVETDARRSFVRYLPLGPVLAVMPWNFPFWQVFRFAAPNLMAGNTGLLKHASNVPQCALAIEDIIMRAGFPAGAFQTLLVGSDVVARIIEDPRVRAVTLTGSGPAGSSVAATAGKAIKKSVLELGGSDAFIIMPSADLENAVETAVKARVINNGQSCIAAKRFIVHSDIYNNFIDRMSAKLDALRVGDPMSSDTDIGPLAMPQIRDDLTEQVDGSVQAGARVVTGARPIAGTGYFYQPGLIDQVPEAAPAFSEELFGPVATAFRISSLDKAIALANTSQFGLGSTIFTEEHAEAERAINLLEAGSTFVNAQVASDPRLPFGGVKRSGFGRELSQIGIREFMNVKTVSFS